jgi:protein TonB
MKKILFTLLIAFNFFYTFAQDTSTTSKEEKKEFSFIEIDDAPIFPGCEDVDCRVRIDCFQNKMAEHIIKNQRYPKQAARKKIQGRILVLFIINTKGEIENIQTKGPEGCELLEKESYRVVSLLPKMKPAIQNGKPVKVKYLQPFNFYLK